MLIDVESVLCGPESRSKGHKNSREEREDEKSRTPTTPTPSQTGNPIGRKNQKT